MKVGALVLAAGYGTRLGDLTREIPKPLLPVHGYPMVGYLLRHLADHGITEVSINTHFRADLMQSSLKDGSDFGVRLRYFHENTLLGTAGTVADLAANWTDADHVLVVYGDLVTDQPLQPLFDAHAKNGAAASLIVHQRPGSNSIVELSDGGRITAFIERPDELARRAFIESRGDRDPLQFAYVNSGIQLLSRRVLNKIPAERPADLARDLYAKVFAQEHLHGVPLAGYRCAVDSAERYQRVQDDIAAGRVRTSLRGVTR